jgi:hypothetical protein
MPCPAQFALSTGKCVRLGDYPVADVVVRNLVTCFDDNAGELMTKDDRRPVWEGIVLDVDICPTDTCGFYLNQYFVRFRAGYVYFTEFKVPFALCGLE